jgi:hypothetical protein
MTPEVISKLLAEFDRQCRADRKPIPRRRVLEGSAVDSQHRRAVAHAAERYPEELLHL